MRIKKFKNIWTMGLIIFGVLLITLYVLKLVNPSFVVGIAEIPAVVKFGQYIDTHKWAYYLFYTATSLFSMYFLCCACCRIKKLSFKSVLTILVILIMPYIIEYMCPQYLTAYNFISNLIAPILVYRIETLNNEKVIYSLGTCYTLNMFAQAMSLAIRNLASFITQPNSATYTILLIDANIWVMLLYFYFNYKRSND